MLPEARAGAAVSAYGLKKEEGRCCTYGPMLEISECGRDTARGGGHCVSFLVV